MNPEVASNDFAARIAIAVAGAEDVEDLPRVPGAGQVSLDNGRRVQTMFQGVRVYADIYYGAWTTKLVEKLRGVHEPQEEYCFHEVLKTLAPGSSMIELGCFWAYYSTWFLKAVPESRAFLVEPDVRNIPAATSTLTLNNVSAPVELGYVGNAPPALVHQRIGLHEADVVVPRVTVPQLAEKYGLEHIDVLHADIQGSEAIMLEECADLLAQRQIGYLFVSTHGDAIHRACMQRLTGAGYRILAEHSRAESFSFDGLIVAASPDRTGTGPLQITKRTPATWQPSGPFYKLRFKAARVAKAILRRFGLRFAV